MTAPTLRLHGREDRSRANGPGQRAVLWFQGCSIGCPGCFNPETHAADGPANPPDSSGRGVWSVADLAADLRRLAPTIEGITLSGGEPLDQAAGLSELLTRMRTTTELSVLLFSGYAIEQIEAMALGPSILAKVDVLIDGPYLASARRASDLRGSENQRIHLLSDRYRREQVEATPAAEITIAPDGEIVITGIDPPRLKL